MKTASRFPKWSRPLFGTDASLPAVIKGYAALRNNRRHAPVRESPEFSPVVAQMDRIGFAELGRPYDPALMASVAAAFERLTANDAAWKYRYESSGDIHHERLDAKSGPMVQRDLIEPARQIPDVNRLLDARTVSLLESCYRTHFRLVRVAYWRNYHVPPAISEKEEVGYSHYWHHDQHAIDTLKLFVVMTDVTDADGPFHVVSKSESRRLVRGSFERKRAKHGEGALQSLQPFTLIGPLGTAALCNTTLCLHRAGIPAPGRHRDLLQFQFVSSATPFAARASAPAAAALA